MHRKEPHTSRIVHPVVPLLLTFAAVLAIIVAGSTRDTVVVIVTPNPVVLITRDVVVTPTATGTATMDAFSKTWYAETYATATSYFLTSVASPT